MNTTTITNELQAVINGTLQLSKQYSLKEQCSEALLLAMLSDEQASAVQHLQTLGTEIVPQLIAMLNKRLAAKRCADAASPIMQSNAVTGLLHLNGWQRADSLQLLKCILRHNNTAAARLLHQSHITLNKYNQIEYKPFN